VHVGDYDFSLPILLFVVFRVGIRVLCVPCAVIKMRKGRILLFGASEHRTAPVSLRQASGSAHHSRPGQVNKKSSQPWAKKRD
jgi:hypothetical protein